ncbi:ATP-binding protein [Catenulispora pinisilvae]|uniref:ATP-binding protein n=1 Tax=Catenulispora pinisilvae TaxID=2705253 RepID=UPI001891B1DF|nr:ATP-binding protein [Catenulispora pinisilvae]
MAVAMQQHSSDVEVALVELRLVPAADMVPGARHHVRRALELHFDETTVDTAELVVSELLSNAIRHTAPGEVIRLRITPRAGGLLRIEATDTNPSAPDYVVAGDEDEGGRGLFLVRAVAVGFGWDPIIGGKALWVHLADGTRR